ncbi:hypothetical protein [Frankia sp. AiPa1]|uniref:hypothetical protein n=1 Tax=Frankia sp. AiPa1 TaxID=573492 RepID=UPI00202B2E0A|nr:hypothetical protein [Frankia sp. AiPa1]MCL9758571.1 hypothetical protein [Frankia sp. AiPa1]
MRVSTIHHRPEELESAQRIALRDADLRVGLSRPGTNSMVDVAGAPINPAPHEAGREIAAC